VSLRLLAAGAVLLRIGLGMAVGTGFRAGLGAAEAAAQSRPSLEVGSLDSIVAAARGCHLVPGVVVAVVLGDSTVLRGYGFARLADSVPADPIRSSYRLASVAKLFVATVASRHVASGDLKLDAPIEDQLDFRLDGRFSAPITLRHLLTHTAGFDERLIGYAAPSREALRPLGEYLGDRMPDRGWAPGTVVSYSNHGMALAAYLVERRAGLPFRTLAARDLFIPAGMTRSYYVAPGDSSLARDQAVGYRCGSGECEPAPVAWSHAYPVGLAFSTAADMARFLRLHLDHGVVAGVRALDSTAVALAQSRHFSHRPDLPGIGLAFFEQQYNGIRMLTHAGGAPGAATVLALVPERRLGVFIATNAGEPTFLKEVMTGILERAAGPVVAPEVRSTGPVAEYAGYYLLARYSHRTVERFPASFAFTVRARAAGDTLLVRLGSEERRFVRVDSLRLVEVTRGDPLRFARDAGGCSPACRVAGPSCPAHSNGSRGTSRRTSSTSTPRRSSGSRCWCLGRGGSARRPVGHGAGVRPGRLGGLADPRQPYPPPAPGSRSWRSWRASWRSRRSASVSSPRRPETSGAVRESRSG